MYIQTHFPTTHMHCYENVSSTSWVDLLLQTFGTAESKGLNPKIMWWQNLKQNAEICEFMPGEKVGSNPSTVMWKTDIELQELWVSVNKARGGITAYILLAADMNIRYLCL